MEHLNDSFESDDRKPSPVPSSYGTNKLNWKHLEMEQLQNDIREPSIHEPTRRKLSGYEPISMLSEPDVDYDTTATGPSTSTVVGGGSPKRRSNMDISIVPSAASIRRKARESSRSTRNTSTLQSSSIITLQSNLETTIPTTKGIDNTNPETQQDSSTTVPTTTTTTTLETTISTKPPKEHVWTGEDETESTAARRKAIQEIMKDSTLSSVERNRKIQELSKGTTIPSSSKSTSPDDTTIESTNNQKTPTPQQDKVKWTGEPEDDAAVAKRKAIQEIMKNPNLTPAERQSQIQSLMIGNSSRHTDNHSKNSSTLSKPIESIVSSDQDSHPTKPGIQAMKGPDTRIHQKVSRNTVTVPIKNSGASLVESSSSTTAIGNQKDDPQSTRNVGDPTHLTSSSTSSRSKQLYSTSGADVNLDVKPGFTAVRGHDVRISAKSRNHSRNTTTTTSPLRLAASALPTDLLKDSSKVESQNDMDDIYYGREYSNSLTTEVTPAAAMLPIEEPSNDTMMLTTARPGVTAVRGNDSRISRKIQTSIIKPANLKGTDNEGSYKDVTKSILDGENPPLVQPGAVASHNDSRVSRKIQSALTHTSSPIKNTSMAYNNSLTSDVEEPEAILPGTVTRMTLEQVSRVARKVGSIARGHPTTTTISSTTGVSLEDISQQDMEKFEDEPCMGSSRPGTAVASRDSRVARKIAQAHNVGAKASKDDSAVGRKIGRSSRGITTKTNSASSMDENSQDGPVIGAVATLGDDPAAKKKSFVRDELFATEEGEEINADDYLMQQIKATQEAQLNLLKGGGKNKKGNKNGKDDDDDDDAMGLHKDGDAAVPKAPGAFAIKGGRGWFTGGFRQRAARGMMSRNKSRAILDAEVKVLNPDEIDEDDDEDWWDRADKPTIIVGVCILIFAIIAITVPVVLLKTKEEPPTPSPTSSRYFLVDEFQAVLSNVTNPKAFQNPSSPQSLALNWMAYDDEMQLDPTNLSAIQRYICMVLYFSNNGTQWKYPLSAVEWGSGVHECEWGYITCETDTVIDKVNLWGVGMVGEIVPEIMYLSELTSLDVSRNALRESKFPTALLQMTKLRYLYLEEIRLKGTIPTEIGRLSKLEVLYLSSNSLSGSLPTELRSLSLLREFQVNMNYLEDDIFGIVEGWPKLQSLDFGNNDFDGTFPSMLPKSLTNLRMERNSISGTLPTELGLLTNLKSLIVTQNFRFTGRIPTELGNCKSLELLHVDSNNIKGAIPTELGKLSKIQNIRLAQNEFSGSIPTQLGRCTSLTTLDLNNNGFNSIIPSQIGQLSNLKLLWLQSTNLSGSMPNEICQLRQLKLKELQADCKFVETAQVQCAEPTCCTGCE
jgi:Leucine-rich repeat (LRR) protein